MAKEVIKKTPEESLKDTLKEIEKMYGVGATMKLGQKLDIKISVISSGSLSLNAALGVGGYPTGRIVEVYGPESSGKTTIALHAIAECQKKGGRAAFIDAEHAIDPEYAKRLGVDISELILSQPGCGEEGLEIADMLAKSGAVNLIVIDSVPALVPKTELEGEMLDAQMGLQARMMSKALRKLTGNVSKHECTIIFINQLREKLGMVFGNPEVTPGGRALKFYSTIRVEVRRAEPIKHGTEQIGNMVNLKVVKNKVAPPFKVVSVELLFGKGLSIEGEIIDLGVQYGIIKKAASWYDYNGEHLAQGRDNLRYLLIENKTLANEIRGKIEEILYK